MHSRTRDELESSVYFTVFMLEEASFNAEMLRSAGVVRDLLEQPQVALVLAGNLQSCHTLATEHAIEAT